MATNNSQLIAWASETKRTVTQLTKCYNGIPALAVAPAPVTKPQLVNAIVTHLLTLAPNAVAPYQVPAAARRAAARNVNPVVGPSISNLTLAPATEGMAYSHTFVASGYANPVTFSILGAPAYLQIDPMTGNMTSTTVVPHGSAGFKRFSIQTTDGVTPVTQPVSLTVIASVRQTAPAVRTTNNNGSGSVLPWILGFAGLMVLLALFAYIIMLMTNLKPGSTNTNPLFVAPPFSHSSSAPVTSVISPETDWKRIVYDNVGRIWMDQILPESQRTAHENSFTAPFGGSAVFNGVNAELWYDSNRDGQPDTLIASNGNNISITLVQDGWYKVKSGSFNGGFDINKK